MKSSLNNLFLLLLGFGLFFYGCMGNRDGDQFEQRIRESSGQLERLASDIDQKAFDCKKNQLRIDVVSSFKEYFKQYGKDYLYYEGDRFYVNTDSNLWGISSGTLSTNIAMIKVLVDSSNTERIVYFGHTFDMKDVLATNLCLDGFIEVKVK